MGASTHNFKKLRRLSTHCTHTSLDPDIVTFFLMQNSPVCTTNLLAKRLSSFERVYIAKHSSIILILK